MRLRRFSRRQSAVDALVSYSCERVGGVFILGVANAGICLFDICLVLGPGRIMFLPFGGRIGSFVRGGEP